MSSRSNVAAMLSLTLLGTSAAAAQTAPAPVPPAASDQPRKPPAKGSEVTVTGSRPQVIDLPDRLSFNVATDLAAQSGSVADALRNVPGVEVDLEGRVSLRGDSGVTILVDGKPSAQMRGDSRGDILQSMPANSIERVEVITNPSAAFSPEGSGGILNLITRKQRQSGTAGTVRANVGGRDRGTLSVSLSDTSRKGLTLTSEGALRRFNNRIDVTQDRARADPLGGAPLLSGQDSRFDNVITFGSLKLGAAKELGKNDRISVDLSYNEFSGRSDRRETYRGNVADPGFFRVSRQDNGQRGAELSGSWRHALPGQDHALTLEASVGASRFTRLVTGTSTPSLAPATSERIGNLGKFTQSRLKLDWKKPLGTGRSLNLGYEGQAFEADLRSNGNRGLSFDALLPLPGLNNSFTLDQVVHAFYGTLQVATGKWEFQPGLRLEQANLDLRQRIDGQRFEQDYFRVYPTISLGRALDDKHKLRASYSRRIQRPGPLDLSPFPLYVDPQNVRQGNPRLKPETTDAFEGGWQYRGKGGTFLSLTAYHRRSQNGFSDIVTPLPGDVLLTTRANLATSKRTGLDAILSGKLGKALSYNMSGTVQDVTLDPDGAGGFARRSATVVSGRANLTLQPSPKDFFQASVNASGKQPLPQGYRLGTAVVNLGYRRKVDDSLSLLFTGQNILDSVKQVVVTRTPTFSDRLVQRVRGRILLVGLAYNFGFSGNRKPREAGFEFDPSATSAGQ